MSATNSSITFKGNKLTVRGRALEVGQKLPQFKAVGLDLADITNAQFAGKKLIVSLVPSIDTPVCQLETKFFNEEAAKFDSNTAVLTVSMDLPFAQKRWCGLEGISAVTMGSDYKYRSVGESFGAYIEELGLLARSVFIADESGTIRYVDYVEEVTNEPNYDQALSALKSI